MIKKKKKKKKKKVSQFAFSGVENIMVQYSTCSFFESKKAFNTSNNMRSVLK